MAATERIPAGHLRTRARQVQGKIRQGLRRQIKDQIAEVLSGGGLTDAPRTSAIIQPQFVLRTASLLAFSIWMQANAMAQTNFTARPLPMKSAASGLQQLGPEQVPSRPPIPRASQESAQAQVSLTKMLAKRQPMDQAKHQTKHLVTRRTLNRSPRQIPNNHPLRPQAKRQHLTY